MKTAAILILQMVCIAGISQAERITLRGGAVIDAPVLKQDETSLIVDLGHTAITLPASSILEVREHQESDTETPQADDPDRIYAMHGLDAASTEVSAKRFSPSVIVVRTPGGLGSGFFVNDEGYLVTNFHVIQGQKRISVTRFERKGPVLNRVIYEDVTIVATDPFHDLAVLKVDRREDETLVPVVLSPNDRQTFGASIFVIGNPLGLERSITKGVISQVARNFGGRLYLQIDASVNPGNSGGPLFNERGQVIGVINMSIPTMQGLNFAIPVLHVKFLLDNLEAYAYDASNPESGFVYPDPPPRFNTTRKEK